MKKILTFEDLDVWKASHKLVLDLYQHTRNFPKEELYGITQQLRRAAISIPNNIAEGNGRHSTKDYIRFLLQARGSLYEVHNLILLSTDLKYIADNDKLKYLKRIEHIGKMLNALIKSLRNRISPPTPNP